MTQKKSNSNETNVSSSQRQTTSNTAQNSQQQRQSGNTNDGDIQRHKVLRRSQRAGVVFPVHRIHRVMKEGNYAKIVRDGAAVYMAGVLEYLVTEITELAGNAAHENKRRRITPRHILLAIRNDEELNKLCQHVTIAEGGVIPHLHEVLLQSKRSSQSSRGYASKKKSPPNKQNNTEGDTTPSDDDDDDDDTMNQ
ncbi:unnamed protein product [Adineta ricciae]|uniref:Histone H2A n=2 Tax=Adineta ricciae TaxID=249248 RepID=A0A814R6J3_ADIRI|nr:unnamed protein product [Adineta ricciae]